MQKHWKDLSVNRLQHIHFSKKQNFLSKCWIWQPYCHIAIAILTCIWLNSRTKVVKMFWLERTKHSQENPKFIVYLLLPQTWRTVQWRDPISIFMRHYEGQRSLPVQCALSARAVVKVTLFCCLWDQRIWVKSGALVHLPSLWVTFSRRLQTQQASAAGNITALKSRDK